MSLGRRIAIVASAALTVGAITVTADTSDTAPVPTAAVHAVHAAARPAPVLASALLDRLTVRPHSHAASYQRRRFHLWVDADHDGENTRAEVLLRQSTVPATENAHHTVEAGRWVSPYDGAVYRTTAKLQIDHLVPLENAWVSGAEAWTTAKREAYANDLGYAPALVAVTGTLNERKGDDDPSGFLPPLTSDDCSYVEAWIGIKARWGLSVTAAERRSLSDDLAKYCTTASSRRMAVPAAPDVAALDGTKGSGGDASSSGPTAAPVAEASESPSASATESASPTPGAGDSAAPTASAPTNQGVVHPGAFCAPEGATGVTSKGTAMACEPGSDGRDRWRSAG